MEKLFVVIRDKSDAWDINKPLRSQKQWDKHASFMNKLAADGFVVLGGSIGNDEKFMLIVNAADENNIYSTLDEDPWSQTGILKISSIQQWTILLRTGEQN